MSLLFTGTPLLAQDTGTTPAGHDAHNHGQSATAVATHDAHLHIEDDVELAATAFSTDLDNLPSAQPVQTVELNDGDQFNITAAYVKKEVGNRTLRMLAYNGSVPGPFIRAPQGAEITIHFTNNTDIDQTIHSHGVRVDNLSDGVPGLTQDSVNPGESYTYKIRFVDAGVFWYHPHTREDYGQEMGLYGNYLITPAEHEYWGKVDREIPLIIDDLLIEDNRIARFYQEFTNYALLGRFGNQYLVNGETDYMLGVRQGERIRFFVTNVSNARTYKLSIPGIPLKITGADLGRFEHETVAENFLISPAERIVVETCFDKPGHYLLTHSLPDKQVTLAGFHVSAGDASAADCPGQNDSLRTNNDVIAEFAGLRDRQKDKPDRNLLLTITLEGQTIDHSAHAHAAAPQTATPVQAPAADQANMNHDQHAGHVTDQPTVTKNTATEPVDRLKLMQWDDPEHSDRNRRTPDITWKLIDQDTGKDSHAIDDWVFKQGQLVKIRLTNDNNAAHVMQHPVHLHGQQFVVLSTDGIVNPNLAWKDTALVLPGQTVDLLVRMTNPGEWMLHCHISEHLHAGMSLTFRVEDEAGKASGDDYRSQVEAHHH